MARTLALVTTDLERSAVGLPTRIGDRVLGRTALAWTVSRLARLHELDGIVLVHPHGQDPTLLLDGVICDLPIDRFAREHAAPDPYRFYRTVARKWGLASWRGGLGGMTCYDELLPAGALADAADAHGGETLVLVGADWMLFDAELTRGALQIQQQHADDIPMAFTQAPPGLAGLVINRNLLREMAGNCASSIGRMLAYDPQFPQPDSIGREVCYQIPGAVRGAARRFIYDTPRSAAMVDRIVDQLRDEVLDASAEQIVSLAGRIEAEAADAALPRHVTLELTPRREICGKWSPQAMVEIDRSDMDFDLARRLIDAVGEAGDVTLALGGIGDAMLHPRWEELVEHAAGAGVLSTAVETDLLGSRDEVVRLLDAPVDVVSVRMNADRAETYTEINGAARFGEVLGNMETLINTRNARARGKPADEGLKFDGQALGDGAAFGDVPMHGGQAFTFAVAGESGGLEQATVTRSRQGAIGVPWVIPRIIRCRETLADIDVFFDRWMHYAGHAMIEPVTYPAGDPREDEATRGGLVHVALPRSVRALEAVTRMTVHSDGGVPVAPNDWSGRQLAGNVGASPMAELWRELAARRMAAIEGGD